MRKKIPILPAALLILAIIVMAALLLARDTFIIWYGIRTYDSIRSVCMLTILGFAAWTGISIYLAQKAARAKARAEHELRVEQMGRGKKTLDETDRQKLYGELADFSAKKWSGMAGISKLLAQLDSMDEYQSEMGRLLDQTDYLKQKPAEIVQKVENCMYVNIRKLLNYMRIIQTRDPGTMRAKIAECEEKNADLLRKTDDFVVAVVAYVNGDIAVGEEEKARTSVDEYMYVVLQAIDLPETRLG